MSFFSEFLKFITENAQNIPDKKENSMTDKKRMTKNQAENIGFKVWEARDPNGKACYEILKYRGFKTDVTFPEYIDDLPVRIIGTNIFERKNPDTEKWENHWIETVRIPKTVILIKDYAFQDCKTLRKVYFEGDIPEIQPLAFQRCANLENPPEIQERITDPWLKMEIFDRKSPPKFETEIINNKFVRIKKIISCREEIVIPEKINGLPVVEVKGGVPEHRDERRRNWGNQTLKKLYFPDSVVKIYKSAFMKCWGLEYLKLPDNKNLELGEDSFWNCEKLRLENVMFPKGKDYEDFMGSFNSCDLLRADYYRKKRAEYKESTHKRKDVFVQNGEFYLSHAMRDFKNVVINDYQKININSYGIFPFENVNIIFNDGENIAVFPIIIQCGRGMDKFYSERRKLYNECFNVKWFNEKCFNAKLYDENILSLLPSMKRKLDVCHHRLISYKKPEEKYKIQYMDFVRKHAKKAVFRAIESHDKMRLKWCIENNLITEKNHNSVMEYAKKKGVSYMFRSIEKHEFKVGELVYSGFLKKFGRISEISHDENKEPCFLITNGNDSRPHKLIDIQSTDNVHERYIKFNNIHKFHFYGFNDNPEIVIDTVREYFSPDEISIENNSGYFTKNGTKINISPFENYLLFSVDYNTTTASPDEVFDMINQIWHKCIEIISEKIK